MQPIRRQKKRGSSGAARVCSRKSHDSLESGDLITVTYRARARPPRVCWQSSGGRGSTSRCRRENRRGRTRTTRAVVPSELRRPRRMRRTRPRRAQRPFLGGTHGAHHTPSRSKSAAHSARVLVGKIRLRIRTSSGHLSRRPRQRCEARVALELGRRVARMRSGHQRSPCKREPQPRSSRGGVNS